MGGLSFLACQHYINFLKSDGRTWDAAITVVLSLSGFLKEMHLVLAKGKRRVKYKLLVMTLQASSVGVEMEMRSGMAVLICPQGML